MTGGMTRRGALRAACKAMVAGAAVPTISACVSLTPDRELLGRRIMSQDSELLRSKMVNVGGNAVHMLESVVPVPPSAPVITLVHGLVSGQYMVPTAEDLAPVSKVYVPDLPGFGDSYKPGEILDVPGLARALADWMAAVGVERSSFLGNSFGCQIITELGVLYPGRVERAVLQGPTVDPSERSWIMQFIRWQQNSKYNPPEMGKVADIAYDKAGLFRLLRTFAYSLDHKMEERLPLFEAPALVVRGAKDPIVRQDWAVKAARLLPNGRLVVVPGVAHTMVFNAPAKLVAACRDFLGL